MIVRETRLAGVLELLPDRIGDDRGFFSETWNLAMAAAIGEDVTFVQDNHSVSRMAGTVRGLHYQRPPEAQAKLVRVTRGVAFDVAVDIRHGSPTFARWVAIVLSEQAWNQLYIPAGFAHGFCTLEPGTEFQYKVSKAYSAANDRSIAWDDPAIGIDWPELPSDRGLSPKDAAARPLAEHDTGFVYP